MAALDPAERCQFRDGLGKQEHSLIEKKQSFSCAGSSLWLHQGFQTLGRTRDASWDRAVVIGGLKRSLVFLGADQTQNGFVEELILILSHQKKQEHVGSLTTTYHSKYDIFPCGFELIPPQGRIINDWLFLIKLLPTPEIKKLKMAFKMYKCQ